MGNPDPINVCWISYQRSQHASDGVFALYDVLFHFGVGFDEDGNVANVLWHLTVAFSYHQLFLKTHSQNTFLQISEYVPRDHLRDHYFVHGIYKFIGYNSIEFFQMATRSRNGLSNNRLRTWDQKLVSFSLRNAKLKFFRRVITRYSDL